MPVLNRSSMSNVHIKKIQATLRSGDGPVECLVFADDQPMLIRRLVDALSSTRAVIIPAPQSQWLEAGRSVADAAVWAMLEAGVDHLVLAGSSACRAPLHELPLVALAPRAEQRSIADALRGATEALRRAERLYAGQVDAVLATPEISARWTQGTLTVHGVFYRVESGVFAAYDPTKGSFCALVPSSPVAP